MTESSEPPRSAGAPETAGPVRQARLHVTAAPSPDIHLFDARGACRLHPACAVAATALSAAEGIRVVVALRDEIRVHGLDAPLPGGGIAVALVGPIAPDGVVGDAVLLSMAGALLPGGSGADGADVRAIDATVGALLAEVVVQAVHVLPTLPPTRTMATARAILSVASALFVHELDRAPAGRTHVRRTDELYDRALDHIRRHIAEPELSPGLVAEACSVSTRYLHMLFEGHGETVSAHIRRERLDRCRDDLARRDLSDVPILDIAAGWGFNTASHFSKQFREAFGMTPRAYRAAALETPRDDETTAPPQFE